MSDPGAREQILLRFNQEPSPLPISFRSLLEAFSPPFSKGTVSARLSELVQEGVLQKDARGKYALAYQPSALSPGVRELASTLGKLIPRSAMQSIVLWEATPFLRDREDGVLAPVLVVETSGLALGSTARMLRDHWPSSRPPHIEEFADRDTLLHAVFGELELQAAPQARLVLVGPSAELFASTALQPAGFRVASAERIVADLLGQDGPALAAVARLRLTSKRPALDPTRLFAAADERGLLPSLAATLAGLSEELPPSLREALLRRLTGAARTIVEGKV